MSLGTPVSHRLFPLTDSETTARKEPGEDPASTVKLLAKAREHLFPGSRLPLGVAWKTEGFQTFPTASLVNVPGAGAV